MGYFGSMKKMNSILNTLCSFITKNQYLNECKSDNREISLSSRMRG